VWVLLATVAPELAEWSAFFAATAATRSAVEAGVRRLVTSRDADDLVRQAGEFLTLAEHAASRGSR
jgi:HEPN superfamily protein